MAGEGETCLADRAYVGSFIGGKEGRGSRKGECKAALRKDNEREEREREGEGKSERDREMHRGEEEKEEGEKICRVPPFKGTGYCLPCAHR